MTRWRADPDALAATLEGGAVLLNLRTNRYHSLNATGTRIWALLLDGKTEEEIVRTLASEYTVAEPTAREETRALIGTLTEAGLLVEHGN